MACFSRYSVVMGCLSSIAEVPDNVQIDAMWINWNANLPFAMTDSGLRCLMKNGFRDISHLELLKRKSANVDMLNLNYHDKLALEQALETDGGFSIHIQSVYIFDDDHELFCRRQVSHGPSLSWWHGMVLRWAPHCPPQFSDSESVNINLVFKHHLPGIWPEWERWIFNSRGIILTLIHRWGPLLFMPTSHASVAYCKQLPPQRTVGAIGSAWHESTLSKETTRPAQTRLENELSKIPHGACAALAWVDCLESSASNTDCCYQRLSLATIVMLRTYNVKMAASCVNLQIQRSWRILIANIATTAHILTPVLVVFWANSH